MSLVGVGPLLFLIDDGSARSLHRQALGARNFWLVEAMGVMMHAIDVAGRCLYGRRWPQLGSGQRDSKNLDSCVQGAPHGLDTEISQATDLR